MPQMKLSGKGIKDPEEMRKEQQAKEYPEDYCLEQVKNEAWLWDMRTWNNYKDYEEMRRWLKDIKNGTADRKNCGHSKLCIELLLTEHDVDEETVINAMLENNKKKYEDISEEEKWEIEYGKTN